MSWNPFLIKFLLKKEVCRSHEQCTGPTGYSETRFSQKQNADAGTWTQFKRILSSLDGEFFILFFFFFFESGGGCLLLFHTIPTETPGCRKKKKKIPINE